MQRVPRRRNCTTRVRSGCFGCKKCHIKCDEAQPTCGRCEQQGAECRYRGQLVFDRSRSRPLAIRPHAGTPGSPAVQNGHQPHYTTHTPAEVAMFDLYRATLGKVLRFPEFWEYTVPKEAMTNNCIWYGLVALGALTRAAQRSRTDRLWKQLWASQKYAAPLDPDHLYAVTCYNRSLSLFRAVQGHKSSMTAKTTIMAVAVFALFETIHGNPSAVEWLLLDTIMNMRNEMSLFLTDDPLAPSPPVYRASDDAVQGGEVFITAKVLSYLGGVPKRKYHAEGTLTRMLRRLNLEAGIPIHEVSEEQSQRAADHFRYRVYLWTISLKLDFDEDPDYDREERRGEQFYLLQQIDQWRVHLTYKAAHSKDLARLLLLQAKLLALQVARMHVVALLDPTETLFDTYVPDYETVVASAECIITEATMLSQPQSKTEMIRAEIASLVLLITESCRNEAIRDRAFVLGLRVVAPMRDWGMRACLLGRWALALVEEEGQDSYGFIPPEARYKWVDSHWDEEHTELTVVLVGLLPSQDGRRRERYKTVQFHDMEVMGLLVPSNP